MFSGIVEETAKIVKIEKEGSNIHFSLKRTTSGEVVRFSHNFVSFMQMGSIQILIFA